MLATKRIDPEFFIERGCYTNTLQTPAVCEVGLVERVADALDVDAVPRRFADFVSEVAEEAWWNDWEIEPEGYNCNPFENYPEQAVFFVGTEQAHVPVYVLGQVPGAHKVEQLVSSIERACSETGLYVLEKLQGIVLANAVEPVWINGSKIPTIARCDLYDRRIVIDPEGAEVPRYEERYSPFGIEPPMFGVLMEHELGHVVFGSDVRRVFGAVRGPSPTWYGDTNVAEDSAESYAIFGHAPRSLGTDRQRGVEQIISERRAAARPVETLYVSPVLTGSDVVYPAFDLETVVDRVVGKYEL